MCDVCNSFFQSSQTNSERVIIIYIYISFVYRTRAHARAREGSFWLVAIKSQNPLKRNAALQVAKTLAHARARERINSLQAVVITRKTKKVAKHTFLYLLRIYDMYT